LLPGTVDTLQKLLFEPTRLVMFRRRRNAGQQDEQRK